MEIFELIIVGLILVGVLVFLVTLRRIVPPKQADVIIRASGVRIYSADQTVTTTGKPEPVYYAFPGWIPYIGLIIKHMPLSIIEIPIREYETFAKENARFVIGVSVYCRISNVLEAAQKFPGDNIDDFKRGMAGIIVSAIRKTTANYAIEDIISKRKEVGDEIEKEIKLDFEKWGVQLTNVSIVDIADAKGLTVIHDISAKKESQINSLSRKEVAANLKAAEVVEAENHEMAEKRKIQATEAIAMRDQEKSKAVAISEQEAVAKQQEVERAKKVIGAEITAKALVQESEGKRQAAINIAEGERQRQLLEGEGKASATLTVGTAEADVIQRKKVAEAEGLSRYADAQKKQQESATAIRTIEKDEKIGLELAKALANAKVKYFGSGDPKTFMDLFKVSGGLSAGGSIGTFLEMIKESDPELYSKINNVLDKVAPPKTKEGEPGLTMESLNDLTAESVGQIAAALKLAKPDLYDALVKAVSDKTPSSDTSSDKAGFVKEGEKIPIGRAETSTKSKDFRK